MNHLCVILLVLLCATGLAADERPNILLIYTDDQSSRTVGCYPESFDWVKTPNIDALAKSGVRFSHAYIGSWCMPSRATLLTGLHQHGIESMQMVGQYPGSAYDPTQCRFWPSVFRANGYSTAQIGKWHTGIDPGYGRDWDHQIVWNRPRHPDNSPNYYDNQLISKNGGPPTMTKGYSTDNYTDWAIDYIHGEGRADDKPWYLWLCYGAVHGPFTPADRHLDAYSGVDVPIPSDVFPPRPGKPKYVREMEFWERGPTGIPVERKVRDLGPVGMKDLPGRPLADWIRQYHEGVLAIDEGVGRLMKALRDSGQDENTLVVFTSDQGFAWGQKGFKSKVAPYRGTVEAPLIIRPPSEVAARCAGRIVDQPVSGVDLPPTFFSFAGIELPWRMHGFDLSPLFRTKAETWNHHAMLVHTAKQYGSATDQIPANDDPNLYHGPGIPWYVMLCEGRYKYIRNLVADETEELYDMESDREELINLAHDAANDTLLKKLRSAAVDELKRTDAGFVDKLPPTGTEQIRKQRVAQDYQPPRCEIVPLANHEVSLRIDGREKLRWHFGEQYPRPFFYPFNGPSGETLTRMGHPGAQNHDHHRSVWFAHHKVDGINFWANGTGSKISQTHWYRYRDGDEEAVMATHLVWVDSDGVERMQQDLVVALMGIENDRGTAEHAVEFQLTFRPGEGRDKVTLEQTNFGILAVRVAASLSAYFGGGRLTNDGGVEGEQNLHEKKSRWMDYSGPIAVPAPQGRNLVEEGITYFDHPSNPGYPTYWHVRQDGWMGASPGMKTAIVITKDNPLVLRYLLHAHSGPVDLERARSIHEAFLKRPGFRIRKSNKDEPHRQYEVERMR